MKGKCKMELDLNLLREDINETDRQIVELFRHRMEVAASVAEYKKQNGLPVLDAARERSLLNRISEMAGKEFDTYARTLYHTMLDVSRTKPRTVGRIYLFLRAL